MRHGCIHGESNRRIARSVLIVGCLTALIHPNLPESRPSQDRRPPAGVDAISKKNYAFQAGLHRNDMLRYHMSQFSTDSV